MILLVVFVAVPVVAGLNILTDGTRYLAPMVLGWTGLTATTFMMDNCGAVEIVAGLIVLLYPGWHLSGRDMALVTICDLHN